MIQRIKWIVISSLLVFLIATISIEVSASEKEQLKTMKVLAGGLKIEYNGGQILKVDDIRKVPFVYQNVTYLPVRAVAEAIGKEVRLDSNTSTLYIYGKYEKNNLSTDGEINFQYWQNNIDIKTRSLSLNINVDNELKGENVQAYLYEGTTFLPMRKVAELVNVDLEWIASDKRIILLPKYSQLSKKNIGDYVNQINSIDYGSQYLDSWGSITSPITTVMDEQSNIHVAVDNGENNRLTINKYNQELKLQSSISLQRELDKYGGFTLDKQGNIYVLWGQYVKENEKDKVSVIIVKYSNTGTILGKVSYKAGEQSGQGTIRPFENGNSSLKYEDGLLVAFFGRTMFKSDDGLNHQSSTALYADAETMKEVTLPIPYSSHSFDQKMVFDGKQLLFVDRGDVYDRGFSIEKIDRELKRHNRLVPFYFKMGSAIYQYTFSELGGIAVASDGYVLVGSAEKTMTAASASGKHNESRNLFLQLIAKNFEETEKPIISQGENARFQVDVYGRSYQAENEGVVWLTNYKNQKTDNVAHPKVAYMGNNELVLMWENIAIYGGYKSTSYMVVTSKGEIVQKPIELVGPRLSIGDDIYYRDGSVYWASDNGQHAILYQLKIN